MKKFLVLTALFMFVGSGSAFAASLAGNAVASPGFQIFGGVNSTDAAGTTSVLLGKTSKGVKFRSNFTTAGFSAATYHQSGSKTYGTAHNSTAIYFKDIGVAAADGAWSLSAADNGAFAAGWTAM